MCSQRGGGHCSETGGTCVEEAKRLEARDRIRALGLEVFLSWELFRAAGTQWETDMGVPVSLNYLRARAAWSMLGLDVTPLRFRLVQALERGRVDFWVEGQEAREAAKPQRAAGGPRRVREGDARPGEVLSDDEALEYLKSLEA